MSLTTALIALAVIVLLMARRFAGEPLGARRLVVPPLILVVFGGYTLSHLHFSAVHSAAADGAVLGAGAVVAVLGGILRGLTVRVFVRNGHVWYRYTWITAVVWLALIVLRVGQLLAGRALGADQDVLSAGLLLILGLSFLGEAAIVGRRAIATGAPFAPRGARRDARSGAGRL
ncbi:hypothetical protein [Dactylosporangium sp. CA-092794]|uniref:hypothetical protein n=1 Tax=Dactylosporangium sp. CA-092794 TaxID=3239929 RepID=UPI003D942BBA